MAIATADQIRNYANKTCVEPARREGQINVTITAGEIHAALELDNRIPAVCSAIDTEKFQDQYRVILSLSSEAKSWFGSRVAFHHTALAIKGQ